MPSQGALHWPVFVGGALIGAYYYYMKKAENYLSNPKHYETTHAPLRPLPKAGEADPGPQNS